MSPGMHCIIEYNTTQRLSKSGSRERVVQVLWRGMLSETDYYRPRYGDQPGVWVLDNSDGGKEKFFVFSRIKSVRETTVDDLLWFVCHFIWFYIIFLEHEHDFISFYVKFYSNQIRILN